MFWQGLPYCYPYNCYFTFYNIAGDYVTRVDKRDNEWRLNKHDFQLVLLFLREKNSQYPPQTVSLVRSESVKAHYSFFLLFNRKAGKKKWNESILSIINQPLNPVCFSLIRSVLFHQQNKFVFHIDWLKTIFSDSNSQGLCHNKIILISHLSIWWVLLVATRM